LLDRPLAPDLEQETLRCQVGTHFRAHHFHRDVALVPKIAREIDRGHAAGAELVLDAIAVSERCAQSS